MSNDGIKYCDYHYYFTGVMDGPAFVCGLLAGHEGEHIDALKVAANELRQKFAEAKDSLVNN